MRLPRFSIAGLMGLVVVVAVGVAALRFASELWAGVLLLSTVGVLGAAILGIIHRRDGKRAWWQGFALFGWGYLALALGPWASEAIAPHLPTTAGLDALYARLHPAGDVETVRTFSVAKLLLLTSTSTAPSAQAAGAAGLPPGWGSSVVLGPPNPTPEFFHRVGHCLWALLAACVGGLVGRAFHAGGSG
ncbi:MAG TPA: hypothetical protein VG406_12695 [Isosphaeraceae bacterium]|jgi:hypothetical protein|nr:hypothetical protein [Isosphaeraceae bacterium]